MKNFNKKNGYDVGKILYAMPEKAEELYAGNPPEEDERFAVSIFNPREEKEELVLSGNSSKVEKETAPQYSLHQFIEEEVPFRHIFPDAQALLFQ